ncbi:MAG: hypothetical protein WAO52_08425 [Prolixibacteraceae bacterium]
MKQITAFFLSLIFIWGIAGCGSNDKSKQIEKYKYDESANKLNDLLKKKVGSWIQEGMECYGLIIMTDKDGQLQALKEIKAMVLIIQSDKIKMKALEDASLAPKAGCTKMGITKGETWWEEEGDLFKTREEAIAFGKTVKIHRRSPAGAKFTID